MSPRRQAYVDAYLTYWNKTKAAEVAGYTHPGQQGYRLFKNVQIQAAIKQRLDDMAMSAGEVLVRLADIARGSIASFIALDDDGKIQLTLRRSVKDPVSGKTIFSLADETALRLVRKINLDPARGLTIEMYSAVDALKLIGQHHRLFGNRVQLNLDMAQLTDEQLQRISAGEDPIDVILSTNEGQG